MSPHTISVDALSLTSHFHSRRTLPGYFTPYLVISHLTWLFHTLPGYFTSYLVISHLTWLFHTLPGYFTPYLVISHLTWLFHILPGYFTPYLVISHLTWLFYTLPGYFTPYLIISLPPQGSGFRSVRQDIGSGAAASSSEQQLVPLQLGDVQAAHRHVRQQLRWHHRYLRVCLPLEVRAGVEELL